MNEGKQGYGVMRHFLTKAPRQARRGVDRATPTIPEAAVGNGVGNEFEMLQ